MNKEEIMKKLQEPFSPEDIEWRVGSTTKDKTKGLALAYVTNRAIQNRLDEVVGPFNWKNEYKEWKGNSQLCGISIWDDEKKEWITKWDGASDTDFEATKGGLSDSMKRAAYQWGIGRYLYKLPAVWVPIKAVGKSYALAETPDIPKEFLPKDYKPTSRPKNISNNVDTENNKLVCTDCGAEINQAVYSYSTKKLGKALCRDCQKKYKK